MVMGGRDIGRVRVMLNHIKQIIFGVVVVVSSLMAMQSVAAGVGDPVFGNRWITGVWNGTSSNALQERGTPEFSVTKAADAASFGTLVPGSVKINGAYYATMKKGYIKRLDIGFEINGNNVNHVNPLRADSLLPHKTLSQSFEFNVESTGLPVIIQNGIIAACNDSSRLSNGQSFFDFPVAMQIVAYRYKRGNTGANKRRDKLVEGVVRAKVNCIQLTHTEVRPKVLSIDIDVKKLGEVRSCPRRIEVRTRIKYDAPQTAKFRFVHNGKQTGIISIKARRVTEYNRYTPGNPPKRQIFLVERVKFYNVGPGDHTFNVFVRGSAHPSPKIITVHCGKFKPTALWMTLSQQKKNSCPKNVTAKIRITANKPGSVLTKIKNQAGVVMAIESIKVKRVGNEYVGKFKKVFKMGEIDTQLMAVDSNNSALNSGWQPLKVTCLKLVKGTLNYQGVDIGKCPRQVKVSYSIHTSVDGKLNYQINCTGGRHWSGKVKAHKTGPNTYLAVGVKSFSIARHEKVSCALKSKVAGQLKLLTAQGHSFSCKQSASDDLTVAPDPVADEPKTPSGFIAPVKCKTNERLVSGRCIRIVIDCVLGFKLVKGRCVKQPVKCKAGQHRRNGKCVKNIVSILCKKGYVLKGKKCMKKPGFGIKCKANERRVRGRCVKPAARVVPKLKVKPVKAKAAKVLKLRSGPKKSMKKKNKKRKN